MPDKEIWVHIGGSCRKLDKQKAAFKQAGIDLYLAGSQGHGHWSNYNAVIPDTPEARALLKKVGGAVDRNQPSDSQNRLQPGML
jgi:hypothetical protein